MNKLAYRIKIVAEIHGQFTLRSGKVSDTYFDKYRFESDPQLLRDITERMVTLIPDDTQVLCGLEMGGIPVVTMLSQCSGIPAAFIRKEPKTHGTCNYAEGCVLKGRKLLIVEDVVSSGGAIIDAVKIMRSDGMIVDRAICVIDRETGGIEALGKFGISLQGLFTSSQIQESVNQQDGPPDAFGAGDL